MTPTAEQTSRLIELHAAGDEDSMKEAAKINRDVHGDSRTGKRETSTSPRPQSPRKPKPRSGTRSTGSNRGGGSTASKGRK